MSPESNPPNGGAAHKLLSDSDAQELLVTRITEKVQERILSRMKLGVTLLVALLAAVGIPAYRDYKAALAGIDQKLENEVQKKVDEYRSFTNQMIDSLANVKAQSKVFEAGLEERNSRMTQRMSEIDTHAQGTRRQMASIESEMGGLRDRITAGRRSVDEEVGRAKSELSLMVSTVRVDDLQKGRQAKFIEFVEQYSAHLGLRGPMPPMRFVTPEQRGALAVYDGDSGEYRIDKDSLESPGLAQHVALMGRLFVRKYKDCSQRGAGPRWDIGFWNPFRYGIIGYLLQSENSPTFRASEDLSNPYKDSSILTTLKRVETASGSPDAARKLAVAALEAYDCDWSERNLAAKLAAVNRQQKIVPEEILAQGR